MEDTSWPRGHNQSSGVGLCYAFRVQLTGQRGKHLIMLVLTEKRTGVEFSSLWADAVPRTVFHGRVWQQYSWYLTTAEMITQWWYWSQEQFCRMLWSVLDSYVIWDTSLPSCAVWCQGSGSGGKSHYQFSLVYTSYLTKMHGNRDEEIRPVIFSCSNLSLMGHYYIFCYNVIFWKPAKLWLPKSFVMMYPKGCLIASQKSIFF